MKSIQRKSKTCYEKENSKFYTYLIPIENKKEVTEILGDLKKEYKDATHYCYAYILDGVEKCSDDGEPSGTAGIPILNVLKQNQLNHVLCVVIRYFGGTKLGAGGLLRAYSKAVSMGLEKAIFVEKIEGYKVKITFPYEYLKQVDYLLQDIFLSYKEYEENVFYEFEIEKNAYQKKISSLKPYLIKEEKIECLVTKKASD